MSPSGCTCGSFSVILEQIITITYCRQLLSQRDYGTCMPAGLLEKGLAKLFGLSGMFSQYANIEYHSVDDFFEV
jgi:hypothetical protein